MNMDGKVTDFFNEINQIAPTNQTNIEWQECFDEDSGYSYYWNMKTNEVSWDLPAECDFTKPRKNGINLNAPPRPAPLFPSVARPAIKELKLVDDSETNALHRKSSYVTSVKTDKQRILTASYGDDSDEEDSQASTNTKPESLEKDIGPSFPTKLLQHTKTNSTSVSSSDKEEEDDDIDLLTQIQHRAKELTQLGGEIPASVKKIVEPNGSSLSSIDKIKKQGRKDVTGFSLVAGYGDSDEEELPLPIAKPDDKELASTLFPLPKPIDVAQFIDTKREPTPITLKNVDIKPLHRKKRINLDIVDGSAKNKIENPVKPDERLGFGFKSEVEDGSSNKNYTDFKSGGLMFVTPEPSSTVDTVPAKKNPLKLKQKAYNYKYKADDLKRVEDARECVSEKLHFLAEGRELATPVQTMIIQMETLFDALKAKCLSIDYLYKWLHETYTELAKLEKGAAPSGWILKWDRIVKRYYYRNQRSGDCQWDYPQPDIVGGDEAMDICTTPPPPPVVEEPPPPPPPPPLELPETACFPIQPPPPPIIHSASPPPPPPPPTISKDCKQKIKGKLHKQPRATPKKQRLPEQDFQVLGEPLPPGVDLLRETIPVVLETSNMEVDALGSALNSFYSDLATMESIIPPPAPPQPIFTYNPPIIINPPFPNEEPEKLVKKKKTKVKIVQGLAMKKKGVSKLVEKWKNVQKDY